MTFNSATYLPSQIKINIAPLSTSFIKSITEKGDVNATYKVENNPNITKILVSEVDGYIPFLIDIYCRDLEASRRYMVKPCFGYFEGIQIKEEEVNQSQLRTIKETGYPSAPYPGMRGAIIYLPNCYDLSNLKMALEVSKIDENYMSGFCSLRNHIPKIYDDYFTIGI